MRHFLIEFRALTVVCSKPRYTAQGPRNINQLGFLTLGRGSRSVIRGARPVDQWPLLDVGTVGSNSVLDPSYLSYLSYQFFNLHN